MRRRTPFACLVPLVLPALLLVGGCGRVEPGSAEPEREGAPRWSAARLERGAEGVHVDLRADVPCRVRLLVVGSEPKPSQADERVLAAGETVRLWWNAEGQRAPAEGRPAGPVDLEAGRTEGWVVALTFSWQDSIVRWRYPVVGTRPGKGRALLTLNALPPVLPATLPYDTDVELCAVGIADGGSADLVLAPGATGARVKGTLDAGAGDRVTIVRLILRLEKAGA